MNQADDKKRIKFVPSAYVFLAISIIFYLILSFNGTTHWDGNNYLYKAAYLPFNPSASWIHALGDFYSGRLVHIFILKAVFWLTGVGLGGVVVCGILSSLMMVVSGIVFLNCIRELFPEIRLKPSSLIFYLFLPLTLYLGYQALAENTALFFLSLSFQFLVWGLVRHSRRYYGIVSGIFLFLAANSRIEATLTFFVFICSLWLFCPEYRKSLVREGIFLSVSFSFFFLMVGFGVGIWAPVFLFRRSEAFSRQISRDALDYPPKIISALLFGGFFWFPALFAFLQLRSRINRFALFSLAMCLVPLLLFYDHMEIRYFFPALFPFSLVAVLGGKFLMSFEIRSRKSIICLGSFFLIMSSVILMPFTESGVKIIPLLELVSEVRSDEISPLIYTRSNPNTFCFLAVSCPWVRAASHRYDVDLPFSVNSLHDLKKYPGPWYWLITNSREDLPWLIRFYRRLRGVPSNCAVSPLIRAGEPFPGLTATMKYQAGSYDLYQLKLDKTGVRQ